MRTAKTLIRLGDAQSDLSLRWAHSQFVVLSCRGSLGARGGLQSLIMVLPEYRLLFSSKQTNT